MAESEIEKKGTIVDRVGIPIELASRDGGKRRSCRKSERIKKGTMSRSARRSTPVSAPPVRMACNTPWATRGAAKSLVQPGKCSGSFLSAGRSSQPGRSRQTVSSGTRCSFQAPRLWMTMSHSLLVGRRRIRHGEPKGNLVIGQMADRYTWHNL